MYNKNNNLIMLKSTYFFLILLGLLSSCKTVSVLNETQHKTYIKTSLGTLIDAQGSFLNNDFASIAIPQYSNPIKLRITPIVFNAKSFEAFQDAKDMQNSRLAVNYIDSIATKPNFLKIEIVDVLELIESVNRAENETLKLYLESKTNSGIITGVSMVVESQYQQDLLEADEVFLQQSGVKSYALKAYKNKELKQSIMFHQGVVFAYKTSNFCWQQNAKYELDIIDITPNKCSKNSFKNSKRAKKEIDYLKF